MCLFAFVCKSIPFFPVNITTWIQRSFLCLICCYSLPFICFDSQHIPDLSSKSFKLASLCFLCNLMILSGLPYFMVQGVPSWTFSACRSYAVDRLLLGLPGALLTRAHTSYEQPPQKFSFWSQCCGLTGSCGSYDCETRVSSNHPGTLK